jgi:hypothetical protein
MHWFVTTKNYTSKEDEFYCLNYILEGLKNELNVGKNLLYITK